MLQKVNSLGLQGLSGYVVTAECDLDGGLPAFDIVGLPDAAVKEARERVRAAARNSGFFFPVGRLTVNLAPANLRKSGTLYDLPILVGLLSAAGVLPPPEDDWAFVGELSLSGRLLPVVGMLPMALAAERAGLGALFVPAPSAPEAALATGLTVYPVETLKQLEDHLTGRTLLPPARPPEKDPDAVPLPDFDQVRGQEEAKRALEIAAAGGHNVLLVGPPGSGKSMAARRLPSILPPMTRQEALEATQIYSVVGLTDRDSPLLTARPFRSPHHTVSAAGMAGGGTPFPKPGEVSLAHRGVLFLDELPEFHRDVLEILRQPMEDGQITVVRAAVSETYPSDFMLVCAMNPCRCGWYGHPSGRCKCPPSEVKRYLSRLSGPLLDRIDLFVQVPPLEFENLTDRAPAEPSAAIRARVVAARDRQTARFGPQGPPCNAGMGQDALRDFCALDQRGQAIMKQAYHSLNLTARSYDRILRVARTIADLDGAEDIAPAHLAEAIQFRELSYLQV